MWTARTKIAGGAVLRRRRGHGTARGQGLTSTRTCTSSGSAKSEEKREPFPPKLLRSQPFCCRRHRCRLRRVSGSAVRRTRWWTPVCRASPCTSVTGAARRVVTRGYDDLEAKRPMSVADRFRIGSVTKSFVATIVLQLVNEGKLSLDDSVEQWLPGVVPNGSAITIRHLLSHRSGLFDYVRDKQILAPYLQGISTTSGRRSRSSGWQPSISPCLRRAPPGSRATRTRATSCSGW